MFSMGGRLDGTAYGGYVRVEVPTPIGDGALRTCDRGAGASSVEFPGLTSIPAVRLAAYARVSFGR